MPPQFNQPIQRVIILIQENCTPDNLFASDLLNNPRRLSNADLVPNASCHCTPIAKTPAGLETCWDPDHAHSKPKPSWVNITTTAKWSELATSSSTTHASPNRRLLRISSTPFVDNTPIPTTGAGLLEPYFQWAEQYGHATYMFQTNQGTSFPAHQFLFTGTSAPLFQWPQRPADVLAVVCCRERGHKGKGIGPVETSAVHGRMPAILDPDGYDLWLDPGMRDVAAVSEPLKPFDARLM